MQNEQDRTMISGATHQFGMDRTQAMPRPDATQMGMSVECAVCTERNLPSETYCSECGFLLESTPDESPALPKEAPAKFINTHTKQVFSFWPGEYSVGRESADILLSDPSVSRNHAKVEILEDAALVTDLGSTNGTVVNGQRVSESQQVRLESGQEVRFGNAVLAFEVTPDEEEEPAESPEAQEDIQEDTLADVDSEAEEIQAEIDLESGETVEADEEEEHFFFDNAVLVDNANGTRYEISTDGASIGRREGNDIVLADPYVSSSHAIVAYKDGAYHLTDVGSTNGTMVNGEKLTPNASVELKPGDEIALGNLVLVFQQGGEEQ